MTSKTLKLTTPTDREIVMTRVFDAPRALVFEALTTPALLKRWFLGPPGWTLAVCEIDLRVGGAYRYVWRGQKGEMGLGGIYKEITPPERIVATEAFDQAWYPGNNALVMQTLSETGGQDHPDVDGKIRIEGRARRGPQVADGVGRCRGLRQAGGIPNDANRAIVGEITMIDMPEVVQTTAQQAAVIRLTIPRSEMRNAFGPAIQS